jgi:hypothetical protein
MIAHGQPAHDAVQRAGLCGSPTQSPMAAKHRRWKPCRGHGPAQTPAPDLAEQAMRCPIVMVRCSVSAGSALRTVVWRSRKREYSHRGPHARLVFQQFHRSATSPDHPLLGHGTRKLELRLLGLFGVAMCDRQVGNDCFELATERRECRERIRQRLCECNKRRRRFRDQISGDGKAPECARVRLG